MRNLEETRKMMPVKGTPYEHQIRAFNFAIQKFSEGSYGIAFLMEMGTGKSFSAIAVIGYIFRIGNIHRVLIVAPLSILSVWVEELRKFADFPYTVTVLTGSVKKKQEQLRNISNEGLQIVLVNYEAEWRLSDDLLKFKPDMVIADEGHKLKDNRSKQSKGMQLIGAQAKYRMLLTGTIISGNEIDVFSPYKFLDSKIFGNSFYSFRNRYFDMRGYGYHTPVFRKSMSYEFLQNLHSIAFRVRKDECLDLPDIVEETRQVELEPKAMKIYKDIEEESFAELDKGEVTTPNVLTRLLRLSTITGGFLKNDDGVTTQISTAKLEALSDIIDSMMAEGKKLVIMARFVSELDAIQELLEKKKIRYSCIRGGVKDRDKQIADFQYESDCMVFLGQIEAAGLGITLTAASTMVFYSLDYSMANFDQAKARIHRAGQTEKCQYIYLCCRDTVDLKVIDALQRKINLAKKIVDDYRTGVNPFKS